MQQFDFQPVIIIGAPRSGTNMLRDVLCRLTEFQTWPCDEINYIWRHGNVFHESDEFAPELASDSIRTYIRRQFLKQANTQPTRFLVEKTCANSLRVPFVDRVIPEARYIFIYRNGLDSAASAQKRWKSEFDLGYTLKKVRFVPLVDLPIYALRYLYHRIYKLVSSNHRLASWGPRTSDMDDILRNHSLIEVCAFQWRQCVDNSINAFERMPQDKRLFVSYESFVKNPVEGLKEICDFLSASVDSREFERAVSKVSSAMVGKSEGDLGEVELASVERIIEQTMARLPHL